MNSNLNNNINNNNINNNIGSENDLHVGQEPRCSHKGGGQLQEQGLQRQPTFVKG
jgi:hypothetical protein